MHGSPPDAFGLTEISPPIMSPYGDTRPVCAQRLLASKLVRGRAGLATLVKAPVEQFGDYADALHRGVPPATAQPWESRCSRSMPYSSV